MATNVKKILQSAKKIDELSEAIRRGFNTAKDHKKSTGVTDSFERAVYQSTSQYEPCTKQQIKEAGEPDVFFPLGALKSRSQYAWIRDVVAGAREKMWIGSPTPIPELPTYIESQILTEINEQLSATGTVQSLSFEEVREVVNSVTDEYIDRLYEEAEARTERMSRVILDQWEEGGWLDTWSEVATDLGVYPISVVKGPVEVEKRVTYWKKNGKLGEKIEKRPIMYRVAPENWYPLPDVGHDVNSGTGVCELALMSRAELIRAKEGKVYQKEAINTILEENPSGYTENDSEWMSIQRKLNRSDEAGSNEDLGAGLYHVIKYYGMMKVETLRNAVTDLPEGLDKDDYVDIEAWMIKDEIIYCAVNPYPLGNRPFCVIPRQFVAGSPYGGESVQSMIETPQKIVNALVRAHIENLSFASQPIGEVEASRLAGGKVPTKLKKGKIYPVLPSQHGNKAFRFTDIPSRSSEFLTAMDYYIEKAGELSGIQSFIEGTPGAESRSTLGQTNFYYSNASKGIGALLSLIDRFLIEPMLERYYIRNMMELDDDSIKGDVQWKARGLAGVFELQQKQDRSTQAIQLLSNLREVMPSYITEDLFLDLVKPIFRNIGVDIDDVLAQNQNAQLGVPEQLSSQVNNIATDVPVSQLSEEI